MRHFLSASPFAAPAPVAALALGVTVPAASRALIPAPAARKHSRRARSLQSVPQYCWPRSQREQMSTWHRHRAHGNSRASSTAPPGGEGWTIRDHRAILRSEPYARADLGAASDVTAKSIQSGAASASSPLPISPQWTSAVMARA